MINNRYNYDEREYIYILKFFAIFSVVCAHSTSRIENLRGINYIISSVFSSIGSIGVPIFFIISGYLFNKSKKKILPFFKGKIRTIFMPWIICETVVWFYVVIRKGGISLVSWLNFMVGVRHSTYYLTVLIIFYILYFYLQNNDIFLGVTSIISIISIVTTSIGVNMFNTIMITPYLNIFNWMLYFSIGIFINRYNLMKTIAIFSRKVLIVTIVLFLIDLYLHISVGDVFSYWSRLSILNTIISIFVINGITLILLNRKVRLIGKIGEMSFSIYLLHELVVGLIVKVASIFNLWYITILTPGLVMAIVIFGIYIYSFIAKKLKCEKIALMAIGAKKSVKSKF